MKVALCAMIAAYAGIAALDNVLDRQSNYLFVQHVLSMDTTFPDNTLKARAITDPTAWRLSYGLIVLGEFLTSVLFLAAAVALARSLRRPSSDFQDAKRWCQAAAATGLLVWLFGFEVVGGEYFTMWQSAHWNGQEAAFRFYMTVFATLIFVSQPDADRTGGGRAEPSDATHRAQ